jgi:hypothetical protein
MTTKTYIRQYTCRPDRLRRNETWGDFHQFNVAYSDNPDTVGRPDPASFTLITAENQVALGEYDERYTDRIGFLHFHCPECDEAGTKRRTHRTRRTIRGSQSGNACEDICAKATGANCSCQCGGMNHGIDS